MFRKLHVFTAVTFTALLLLTITVKAEDPMPSAESSLPAPVLAEVHAPLKMVGEGNYRKLGFKIYHASLWTHDGIYKSDKPFVLKMQYARSLSKDTLVDAVMGDIRDQHVADDATLTRWHDALEAAMPAIAEDDTIVGVSLPGKKAMLFHNNDRLTGIDDKAFGDAFFNIWLGPNANEDLQKQLLGQADQ